MVPHPSQHSRSLPRRQKIRYRPRPRSTTPWLRKSVGQREDTGDTACGEGEIFQQGGGAEDQGGGRGDGVGCLNMESEKRWGKVRVGDEAAGDFVAWSD